MSGFIQVVEDEGDDPIELPLEEDGTLLVSTLAVQFTGACGLKYRNPETQMFRGVRLSDGKLYAPDGDWSGSVFTTVYPKEKRKGEVLDNPAASKSKRISLAPRVTTDLIILGLPWKTTEEDLTKHFQQFGELVMVQLKRDPTTKQSKGFGFVRFVDYESQLKAMSQRHKFEDRFCDLKIPASKEGQQNDGSPKIYVGRITESMTSEELREYFSQFGVVTEVYLPKPFRAFAFVTFTDPLVAASLHGDDQVINGTSVHISSATKQGGTWNSSGDSWRAPGDSTSFGARKGRGGGSNDRTPRGGFPGGFGQGVKNNAQGGFGGTDWLQGAGGLGGGGAGVGAMGGFGVTNPVQLNSAMMAAAQAALLGFMSQAAGGAGAFGVGGGVGGNGGAGLFGSLLGAGVGGSGQGGSGGGGRQTGVWIEGGGGSQAMDTMDSKSSMNSRWN